MLPEEWVVVIVYVTILLQGMVLNPTAGLSD